MTTSKNTVWAAGAAVLAVLLVVGTYLLVISPQRSDASDLKTQVAGVQQSNAQIEAETARLRSEYSTLDEKKRELAAIKATLPSQAEVPALLRQLEGYAATSGVSLTSVTPASPVPYTSGAATAEAAAGLYSSSLSVSIAGSFAQIELYLKNVSADMGRFYLVKGVSLTTGAGQAAGAVTATIDGEIFIYQDGAADTAATATTTTTGTVPSAQEATPAVTTTTQEQ